MSSDAALIAIALGLIVSSALAVRSIFAFSHTGPQIREEVLRHYARYSLLSLGRLGLWAAAITTWLAALGMLAYRSATLAAGSEPSPTGLLASGIAAVALASGLQFLDHLLRIPAAIVMSSNYKMSRFYGLWRCLSVTRIRWLRLLLVLGVAVPVALGLFEWALAGEWRMLGETAFWGALLGLPAIWTGWPALAPRRASVRDGGPPNILMIGCDTLRADRLGASGYPRPLTPFLDALGRRGTLFTSCYTPIGRTAPSLVSLLTGTWPQTHGIRTNYVPDGQTRLRVQALPELLRARGYDAVAVSDWSGSDFKKLSFGFRVADVASDQWNLRYLIRQGPKDIRLFLSLFTHNRFGKRFMPELYHLAGIPLTSHLGHEARRWLSRFADRRQPFLLNVFMATTHPPFGSEYPYYTYFADPGYRGESKFAMARLVDPVDIIRSQREPKEAFDLDQVISLYDACVRNFDDEVRKIVHHLRACGLGENTLVVVYSDHGMEFFEHNTWGQGNSARGEASARVPLLIVDPRRAGHGADARIVRTVDLVPTLLELCGQPVPDEVQGVSLVPYLEGEGEDLNLEAYFETGEWLAPPPDIHPDHIVYPDLFDLLEVPDKATGTLAIKDHYQALTILARDRMIRKDGWKLVRLALERGPCYQLFDLRADPDCRNDRSREFPAIGRELATRLEGWITADRELGDAALRN